MATWTCRAISGAGGTAWMTVQASGTSSGFGISALPSNTGSYNTGVGGGAMQVNTTGFQNTAAGFAALAANIDGINNTAAGVASLLNSAHGNGNTGFGVSTLANLIGGGNNLALGLNAGSNLTLGNNNIYIGHGGVTGDNGAMRIGTAGTHTTTFIAGVRGVTTGANDALPVVIDSAGQLGTSQPSQIGISGLVTRVHQESTLGAGNQGRFFLACPADYPELTGGGCGNPAADASQFDIIVNYSGPYPEDPTVWQCSVNNNNPFSSRTIRRWVICSK